MPIHGPATQCVMPCPRRHFGSQGRNRLLFSWPTLLCLLLSFLLLPFLASPQQVPTSSPIPASPQSPESFINQVFRSFVDSSFSTYRLSIIAYPCSFVRFDYDEWVKYALRENVPVYTLNELAGQAFAQRSISRWLPDSLDHAVCIPSESADSARLTSTFFPSVPSSPRKARRLLRKWNRLPPEQRVLFFFSRPVFNEDGSYAILDMSYRCDTRACGLSATCLFKRQGGAWQLIGKKLNWSSQ